MTDTGVLIAGAGPVGLTAAIELARRGIDIRIVDPLVQPPQYAKAVGVQPRTLEVFEGMGVLNRILIAAPDADVDTTVLPLIRDSARDFAAMYAADGSAVYVVRPDGYLCFTSAQIDADALAAHLSSTFDASVSATTAPGLR